MADEAVVELRPKGRLCGAQKRQSAKTCTQPAGWGTDHPGRGVCKFHGGTTINHRKAAALEAGREAIVRYQAQLPVLGIGGDRPMVHPLQVLVDNMHRAQLTVYWLDQVLGRWQTGDKALAALEDRRFTNLPDAVPEAPPLSVLITQEWEKGGSMLVTDTEFALLVKLRGEQMDRASRLAKMALDADAQNRLLALGPTHARYMRKVLDATLEHYGITVGDEVQAVIVAKIAEVNEDLAS